MVGDDGVMRLLLVRHGQTSSNVGHHLDTVTPGADLTELGRRQAAAVPAALAGEDLRAVYVSTLVRTHQTAEPTAEAFGLQPRERAGIREIAAGDYEMRNDAEAIEGYLGTIFAWDDDPERRVPGAESGAEVFARFDEVVAEAHREVGDDGTALVVSHGAVIRAWSAARADNVDLGYAASHWLPNTGMVALEGDPDAGWTVACWTQTPLGGVHLRSDDTGPAGKPEDEAVEDAESD